MQSDNMTPFYKTLPYVWKEGEEKSVLSLHLPMFQTYSALSQLECYMYGLRYANPPQKKREGILQKGIGI